ncbi:1-phosphofructokinase [Halobacillus andaensis]|uniref:Tagatose-6-phosphate kinase n=1 Tax=Halobacillus andaensis TaxID=1176239 RepID=A0A917EXR3_HALAA|nr:1-phosphofructokinase [Halobacillus andaensis]MBP2005490.1 1-phosphofructokinase [Halobacillus andaensis]GGF31902.1 1-phosphofructokinase [Halobacillus andaensis]
MIYTCTLNPSIDYIMHVEDFHLGELNRAHKAMYYPGGKGINVSRVMERLGVSTTALGFIGQFTGQFITDFLDRENIYHNFVETNDYTRINVKLKGNQESEINGPGPAITVEQKDQLFDQIRSLHSEDLLILAGSVPSSLPKDFYSQVADICASQQVPFIADTSGDALRQLIGKPIFFLKPNDHELGELFDTVIETKEQAAYYASKLVDQGTKHVVVSMGGKGAVYVSKEEKWFAKVPKGEVKNSVGAGDSVVSGFIAAISSGSSIEEAFRSGVATGSATAFQDDLCQKEDADRLKGQIEIAPIRIKEGQ